MRSTWREDETAEEAEERAKREARMLAAELYEAAEAGELYKYLFGNEEDPDEEDPDEGPALIEYLSDVTFTSRLNPNGGGMEYVGAEFEAWAGATVSTVIAEVEVSTPYGPQTWPLSYNTVNDLDDIFCEIFDDMIR